MINNSTAQTPSQKTSLRIDMPCQPPQERIKNFNEVALGYTSQMASAEASRCLKCKTPRCVKGCPVEVPIKDFIEAVAQSNLDKAYQLIKKSNALPAICGRVCPQEDQCEGQCILNRKGQAVAIGRLERFVADSFLDSSPESPQTAASPTKGLVACLGAGPSSLTVAGDLAQNGFKVTVFEALHQPGGVLVYGIPEFRLPKGRVVAKEIEALKSIGVEFVTNHVGGRTSSVEELFTKGYQAVFIGVGAGLPIFLGIEGENLIGVFSANEYLTRANLGRAYEFPKYDTPTYIGRKVTVFGGGNVAMDAARTALRLGAESVSIVYRRTRNELPCRHEELEHAEEEGVQLALLNAPLAFKGDSDGRLASVELQRMELGPPDARGRLSPVPITGDLWTMETDLAIIAIGTRPNPVLLDATPSLKRTPKGYIATNEFGETSIPNVFAGGDIVTGSATVILAMGAGRTAAKEIIRRFG
ncbi:MAG: NADPH-dependent glutamate synthase [Deltaproteobacteria bacterium]|jgi:glutamate synthase (NADPH/NADH) small chain|nr:NADPH-dependent glutamate synthase [Deltaproteobacteria bacterium]